MQPGNPDIRSEVEKNSGLLKKIQVHLPFFKGYRQLEDLREADELLRKQISDVLVRSLQNLHDRRMSLVNDGKFDELTSIASEVSKIEEFQGEVLHSQQGYSGISPTIRMDEAKVGSLYDYDLKLLDSAQKLLDLSNIPSGTDLADALSSISKTVNSARDYWKNRMVTVKEILISPGGNK